MANRNLSRQTTFALAVCLAFVGLTSASLILLATILSQHYVGIYSLVITAVTLHFISAILACRLCWRQHVLKTADQCAQGTRQPRRKPSIGIMSGVVSVGHAVTLASIIWIMVDNSEIALTAGVSPALAIYMLISFWILCISSQAAFLWCLLAPGGTTSLHGGQDRARSSQWPGERNDERTPCTVERPRSSFQRDSMSLLHAMTAFASAKAHRPFVAFRFSPAGDRSGSAEPLRPGLARGASTDPPSPRPSNDSAFDFWDTSSVSVELRRSVKAERPRPLAVSDARLPTIPGSRPASPAKPLDGPFHADINLGTKDEPTLPPSPHILKGTIRSAPNKPLPNLPAAAVRSHPFVAHHSSIDSLASPSHRLMSHDAAPGPELVSCMRSASRASTCSYVDPSDAEASDPYESWYDDAPAEQEDSEQANIHPLFRTTSPSPAPGTSPNTVLTAAPVSLVDIPTSIVMANVAHLRETRGLSFASVSTRSNPTSPPLSPDFLHTAPQSPLNPASRNASRPQSRCESRVDGSSSRPPSRLQSRSQSRAVSRNASRNGSRTNIVLQGPAGDVPPTPTSPMFQVFPNSPTSPMFPMPPSSPIVAVGPKGKILTRDDLIRTGNRIVCNDV